MKQLTIISHTEHYKAANGELVGFGATVTEINHLLEIFDKIIHVAVLYDSSPPPSAIPYNSKAISFVPLPVIGGKGLANKLDVLWNGPKVLSIIHKSLKESTYFQFRAPTGIGVYVIPYLMFFCTKKGWFKYAGNWKQEQAPLAYRFQRWLLKHQNRLVTINGSWNNQPNHCLSFENPCLTEDELQSGKMCRNLKKLPEHKTFCFVGRLEPSKGIDLFIDSLKALPKTFKHLIDTVHFIGHSANGEFFQQTLKSLDVSTIYHGTLERSKLHEIYKKSHFIVLPSKSEGFPKVISEALNYGCVPILSNVSAIEQYIKNGLQGILLEELNKEDLVEKIQKSLSMEPKKYQQFIFQSEAFYKQFSYSHYNDRILKEILKE